MEVRDGSSAFDRVLGKYCGSAKPRIIFSSGRFLRVNFRSDSSVSHQGFSAEFVSVGLGEYSFQILIDLLFNLNAI